MDITMCKGDGCPFKEKCHRFIGEKGYYYQSFFTEEPYNKETNKCEYLWTI